MATEQAPKAGRSGVRNKGIKKAAKERRRKEAEERAAAYAKKPLAEKLKFAGAREKARLMKQQEGA